MNRMLALATMCTVAILAAGCATNGEAPLLFAASNIYGVSIGGNVADTGGEFVVGHKGADFAVIPVSAIQPGGGEELVGAADRASLYKDSYSVIGQFGGSATKTKKGANAGLGKFFATGTAAQNIAQGFAKKMGVNRTAASGCSPTKPTVANADEINQKLDRVMAAINGHEVALTRIEDMVGRIGSPQPAAAVDQGSNQPSSTSRSGAKLIFAQYEYLALAIDGSVIDQGIKLTLGFRDKNVALIPVLGRDAQGKLIRLESRNPASGQDAYSVLGQFESTNDVNADTDNAGRTISSSLNSFFSTGAAAVILSGGFKVKLCEEYAAPTGTGAGQEQK